MHFNKGVPCTWEYEPYDEERVLETDEWKGDVNE